MILRILGKKGRTTIPFEIRKELGIRQNDVLSFTPTDDGRGVVIRKEIVCDGCKSLKEGEDSRDNTIMLYEYLNELSPKHKRSAYDFLRRYFATGGTGVHER